MTPAGFCAEAALGAAETGHIQGVEAARTELRALLRELFAARTAVNRFGINVNQAVAALHSTGQPPVWLADAVALCGRAVDRLDGVAEGIARRVERRGSRSWRR